MPRDDRTVNAIDDKAHAKSKETGIARGAEITRSQEPPKKKHSEARGSELSHREDRYVPSGPDPHEAPADDIRLPVNNEGALQNFSDSLKTAVNDYQSGAEQPAEAPESEKDLQPCPERVDGEHAWDNSRYSLEGATNAHRTNTEEQFDAALDEDTKWLEGDVRPEIDHTERLEMRHDEGHEDGDNLTLSQWLDKGLATGRGLKLDIKDTERTPQVLDEVEKAGVPDERLMFNLGSGGIEKYGKEIRERFPESILAINPPSGELTGDNLLTMIRQAEQTGQPVTFVLREDNVSKEAIDALKGHGTISVWNSPGVALPGDTSPAERAQRLKEQGVNGLIDLRPDESLLDIAGGAADKIGDWLKDAGSGLL